MCFVFIAAELACSAAEKALLDGMVDVCVWALGPNVYVLEEGICGQMVCGDCLQGYGPHSGARTQIQHTAMSQHPIIRLDLSPLRSNKLKSLMHSSSSNTLIICHINKQLFLDFCDYITYYYYIKFNEFLNKQQ